MNQITYNALHTAHVFTESDDNEAATAASDAYSYSKAQCEKVVNEFVRSLPADEKFSYAFINPTTIFGPLLSPTHVSGSPQIIRDFLTGVFPLIPDMSLPDVDIRDVARAHVAVMVDEALSGRFIISQGTYTFRQVCDILKAEGFANVRCLLLVVLLLL